MNLGVVVGTFGTDVWRARGEALSERLQQIGPAINVHADSLAAARNRGAETLDTEYVVFVDADDELDDDFGSVFQRYERPGNLLYQSETRTVSGGVTESSVLHPDRDLRVENHLGIGTVCRRSSFLSVGGFDPTLPALEDWDLWNRMILDGAKVLPCPGMIYVYHPSDRSRNHARRSWRDALTIMKTRYGNESRLTNYMVSS